MPARAPRPHACPPPHAPALANAREPLPDEATGVNILRRALEEPLRQIAENAGYEGSVVIANVRGQNHFGHGFDAVTGQYVDMFCGRYC